MPKVDATHKNSYMGALMGNNAKLFYFTVPFFSPFSLLFEHGIK
jgi:hypothetical protein